MPLLFSYGTLREEAVQVKTFGRKLRGRPDELVGFEQSLVRVEDPDFVAVSGKAHHSIVRFTGRVDDRVSGVAFEVSPGELAQADGYEPSPYKRIPATLASGREAWVYAEDRRHRRAPSGSRVRRAAKERADRRGRRSKRGRPR